jgi:transcription antitermination factor NusG
MNTTDLGSSEVYQTRRWYACHTRSRHEKRVVVHLGTRGLKAYLPLVARTSRWHDRDKTILWPLYPGYVFACLNASEISTVVDLPGVVALVSSGGRPLPIDDADLDNVRRVESMIAETGKLPVVEPLVEEGEHVRITSGPLDGMVGVVLERRGPKRILLHIGLRAIGQGVKLELDASYLSTLGKLDVQAVTP